MTPSLTFQIVARPNSLPVTRPMNRLYIGFAAPPPPNVGGAANCPVLLIPESRPGIFRNLSLAIERLRAYLVRSSSEAYYVRAPDMGGRDELVGRQALLVRRCRANRAGSSDHNASAAQPKPRNSGSRDLKFAGDYARTFANAGAKVKRRRSWVMGHNRDHRAAF